MTLDATTENRRLFAVVATQRSGSTLLVRSLDASPQILCAGEIFHGGPNVYHAEYNFRRAVLRSRTFGRVADRLFQRQRIRRHLVDFCSGAPSDIHAVGFKVMASQTRHYQTILPLLRELRASIIFLHRRDQFALALSTFRARKSGIYHSDRTNSHCGEPVVTAAISEFRDVVELCAMRTRELLTLHATYGGLLLNYEDMVSNWDQTIANVGNTLGLRGLHLDKVLDRLESSTVHIRIANEDDLRRAFVDCELP